MPLFGDVVELFVLGVAEQTAGLRLCLKRGEAFQAGGEGFVEREGFNSGFDVFEDDCVSRIVVAAM